MPNSHQAVQRIKDLGALKRQSRDVEPPADNTGYQSDPEGGVSVDAGASSKAAAFGRKLAQATSPQPPLAPRQRIKKPVKPKQPKKPSQPGQPVLTSKSSNQYPLPTKPPAGTGFKQEGGASSLNSPQPGVLETGAPAPGAKATATQPEQPATPEGEPLGTGPLNKAAAFGRLLAKASQDREWTWYDAPTSVMDHMTYSGTYNPFRLMGYATHGRPTTYADRPQRPWLGPGNTAPNTGGQNQQSGTEAMGENAAQRAVNRAGGKSYNKGRNKIIKSLQGKK